MAEYKRLEERLDLKNLKAEILIYDLNQRNYSKAGSKNNPYYKYNLVDSIENYLMSIGSVNKDFKKNLDSILNKPELKKVYYGMKAIGKLNNKSKEIINKLYDWEKVYFFAGIWVDGAYKKNKTNPNDYKNTFELLYNYIKKGIDYLHKEHMVKFHKGIYKRKLKLPLSQYYKKCNKLNTAIKQPLIDIVRKKPKNPKETENEQLELPF